MSKKVFYLFFLFLALPVLSLALCPNNQQPPCPNVMRPPLPLPIMISNFIATILDVVWIVALTYTVVTFTMAGIKFLTAQGNPQKVAEARQAVIWGVVGVMVVIIAWSATAIMRRTIGV